MKEKLENLVKSVLSIPCETVFTKLVVPSATYSFYNINPVLFGDGECTEETESVQVDLWYRTKTERDLAADKLHKAFKKQRGYTYPYLEKYYDEVARLYRATFKFDILKESEE